METTTKYKWLLTAVTVLWITTLIGYAGTIYCLAKMHNYGQAAPAANAPVVAVVSTDKTIQTLKLKLTDMEQDNRLLKEELKNVQKSAHARIAALSNDGVAASLNMQLQRYREERSADSDDVE